MKEKLTRTEVTKKIIMNLASDCESCGRSFDNPPMVKNMITAKKHKKKWRVLCIPCYTKSMEPKNSNGALTDNHDDYAPSLTTWHNKKGDSVQHVNVFINKQGKLDVKISKG
ncbi:MAG: hypothetical protein KAS32_06365 [Candidatus Peribacteraceae bacterium]|nr:hypothetical protein [Candidatus Peribacteraceae bacterium]